jgi:uncharacterized membrane protein YhaH (DUF805 family)
MPIAAAPLKVSFSEALPLAFSNYANFEGRATRGVYWWFVLGNFFLTYAATLIGVLLFGVGSGLEVALYWVVVLALAIPGMAVFARRLHDTGRSGWWWLLCLTIIGAIPVLLWLSEEGDVRPNAYGPPRTA